MKASALAALVVIAILITLPVDVPKKFGIKGDESTYVAMALSLAYDGDLKFRQEDLQRFEQIYGMGPEGIFLKQGYRLQVALSAGWPPIRIEKTRRPARQGLDFGKPFIYSAVAAPFVRIAGVRGLLILNLLLAVAVLWMAVRFASRRMSAPAAIVVSLAFVGASIAGLYTVWLTSEFFNFALVFAGFFFWLFKEVVEPAEQTPGSWLYEWKTDLIAAFLFGLATFSKPPNALLVAPLILTLAVRRRWRGAALTCVVFLVASAGAFAVNGLVAGEMNYQGGDRRTFYGRFPYGDPTITFDRLGQAMVTEDTDAESLFAPNVMFPLLGHNVVYFVVGRHAGLIPYFFPGVAILAAWALRPGRWRRWQTFSVLTLGASVFVMLVLIPYSWNGGGGPPGNRYFLSLYPVLFFLLPATRGGWPLALSTCLGLLVVGPLSLHPLAASRQPWHNAEHGVVRVLPVELTMVDDLPVRLGPRARIPFGVNRSTLIYLLDENTFSPEGPGFWVAGSARTDIIVRTETAVERAKFVLRSAVPNHVSLKMGSGHASMDLRPQEAVTVMLDVGPGVVYTHGSRAYVLTVATDRGFVPRDVEPGSSDGRFLGVFVEPDFTQQSVRVSATPRRLHDGT
jgi:hypothetical protein